ncbi:MAG TPA: hypothetical protein PK156_18060 [Polyangium sp.]|nr:hypothetical protein [Polyangium sp.]
MSEIKWSNILSFIHARDPSYWHRVQGVTRAEIARCEDAIGVALPKIYVEFLKAVGIECSGFSPFGSMKVFDYYSIVERMPAHVPANARYFRIALDDDASVVEHYDVFLDLLRSDGDDAPIVSAPASDDICETDVIEHGFTLGEALTRAVVLHFDISHRSDMTILTICPDSHVHMETYKKPLLDLMAKMRVNELWPASYRVACFRNEATSVLIEYSAEPLIITCTVGATSHRSLRLIVEQIQDQFDDVMEEED